MDGSGTPEVHGLHARVAAKPAPVRTTCPYCGVGCGVLASVQPDGRVAVAGDPDHPANLGRLCSKGTALAETLGLDGRLLHPEIGGRRASWDAALDLVASRFSAAIAEHGPDSVAFYVSGQLLTEDYYVANKLMKGFIGAANIDTNSRLCMASSVAGHKRAFGADVVPGTYEDLELADLIVLVGSNLAWCHPVLHQRIMAARERRGTRLVVIDPRRTATAEDADIHLALKPGSDVALFAGLLHGLYARGATDRRFVGRHTAGLDVALATARDVGIDGAAAATGIPRETLRAFYDLFAATERAVTVFSQGVNQSSVGTDKVNAIVNCHLATGRIGKPGAGPFSITGQPNAMGGREVGGLANQLAAHMAIESADDRDRVRRFWQAPRVAGKPGLKAVDLFDAVADGRIKALWIMATNPVDSMPRADAVKAALEGCPFVVVSDVVRRTDSTAFADVLLPASAWGEKDGTVTNSERRISRQRPFVPPPGEAKPDWWAMAEVGRRMGFMDAFAYPGPAGIFREHASLSSFENSGARAFDIGGLATISDAAYDRMTPVRWPVRTAGENGGRFFADGRFFTGDGHARFIATAFAARRDDRDFPLVLNTGRVRDHWHTMTRTGRSPRLSAHIAEPYVEIHPDDAEAAGIVPATLATVTSRYGSMTGRALVRPSVPRGSVFVPMHWTGQTSSTGRVDAVTGSEVDPVSGQPDLKGTNVRLAPFPARWFAFAAVAERPQPIDADYWAAARADGGWRIELAGMHPPPDWETWAALLLGASFGALAAYCDERSRQRRFAVFCGDRLNGAVFIADGPVAVSRTFLAAQLTETFGDAISRAGLLAGRPCEGMSDDGAVICSCLGVGVNRIAAAIAEGCDSVERIGKATHAGTNCGACRPELRRLLGAVSREQTPSERAGTPVVGQSAVR